METLQVASELHDAVELYKARKPKRVLEVGVWYGGTLKEWLTWARCGAVVCAVDLHHPNLRAYEHWQSVDTDLHPFYGNSHDPGLVESVKGFGPFDWVFIDGDHSLQGVATDVENFLPMVAPGGALLLHDIAAPDDADGILYPPGHVFGQLAGLYNTDAFVSNAPSDVSHGIGVVFVP